jgi:hypothetical protein
MPATTEQITQDRFGKKKSPTTYHEVVRASDALTDQDYDLEIAHIREVLAKAPAFYMGKVLNGKETLEQMRWRIQVVAGVLDGMNSTVPVPGTRALQEITGQKRLEGKYGAIVEYETFLREYRLRKPSNCADNFWTPIAGVYASILATCVLSEGLSGDRVLADRLAFQDWKEGREHGNRKPRPGWVPEPLFREIPRGVVPPVSSNNGQLLTAPEAWDSENETKSVWSQQELDLGIKKKIEAENSYECNLAIPKALANEGQNEQQHEKGNEDEQIPRG